MSNPFITPDNPLGRWELPYEGVERTDATVDGLLVDSVDITAGVTQTEVGELPILIFAFKSSALPPQQQPPRLLFIGDANVMQSLRRLVDSSVAGAIRATHQPPKRRRKGR